MFDVQVEHFGDAQRAAADVLRLAIRSAIAGQEPRLYALGQRFREGNGVPSLAEVRRRFVADGRDAPRGAFTVVRFRPEDQLSRVMQRVDPAALEGRLIQAARDALRDRLGWAQGVLHVSHGQGPERSGTEVLALLSARRSDGGPARLLGPVDVQGLAASWYARSHDAMGLTRDLPKLEREATNRLGGWRESSRSLGRAWAERLRGDASPDVVRVAAAAIAGARQEWNGSGRRAAPDDTGPMRTLRLSVEGGGRYLAPLDGHERREALRLAVERVGKEVGVPGAGAAHWERRESGDLQLLVYYNQPASGPERAAVERAFTERLGRALEEEAGRYAHWPPRDPPGSVRVERDPSARDLLGRVGTPPREGRASFEGRPAVRFRLEDGARHLSPLSEHQKEDVLERAARRAFPGGWTNGDRPQLEARVTGSAAVVRVYLPAETAGRWPDLFPAPEAQARFSNEVYRAGAGLTGKARGAGLVVLPTKLPALDRQSGATSVARAVSTAGASRVGLERLSAVMPGAFRVARGVSRLVGSLLPSREE